MRRSPRWRLPAFDDPISDFRYAKFMYRPFTLSSKCLMDASIYPRAPDRYRVSPPTKGNTNLSD